MESLKDHLKYSCVFVLLALTTACADRDNDDSSQKSFPSSKYVCENSARDTKVTLVMEDHPDEKYLGDLVTTAIIESEGLEVEVGLMLAMSFRDNRGIYEIRQSLSLRNIDKPASNNNIVVKRNADQAPLMMSLNVERDELAIQARPLKRLIQFGLT
ncbi:MAG: hypothetical protein AAF202_13845, partial [Pseudomonadota bacterium]